MPDHELVKYRQLDLVRLLTTKNVIYVSAPPGSVISSDGEWMVAGAVNQTDLLLSKGSTIIRIPAVDVLKVFNYDLDRLQIQLGKLSHAKDPTKRN